MTADVKTKLSAARTRLILDKPFLGALVLRLPLVEADPRWCKTTATDARRFYYNAQYIDGLSLEQTQFMLAHEALHCALSHFARRQHRVKQRWDLACDLAINPLLIRDGLKPPPGALYMSQFEGMTAEEVYPAIDDLDEELESLDQHLYDSDSDSRDGTGGGSGRPPPQPGGGGQPQQAREEAGAGGAPQPAPLSEAEREQLQVQWQQRLAGAAQQALQAGKLGGGMARLVDHLLAPRLPWRMLLAKYMTAVARDDYNYSRPSRREGPAILPSLRSSQIEVVVALDTSGSISPAEMAEFISELDAIKGQVRARLTLLACDARLAEDGPWEFEPWEAFKLPRDFAGGGGTRFTPVFDWVAGRDRAPDLLVYFTDAEGEFPKQAPPYPVLWLVKGKAGVPWGQRVQLN
ncbi:VWA-like domain-containing protein [Thiohalobacter sp. IOR34]|uniref:vWA domain-containing protein n=1 Tax=Thiohalobacter sp. IOR34 TaxID=3057176 RepID=UPI0025B1CCDE|nr:VWA-like domain-containing protein [Thiohalobacter sp. IOR34]WJW74767.1 VWA-like domain-containing protein [Thiohalobacter sp. IOR34]